MRRPRAARRLPWQLAAGAAALALAAGGCGPGPARRPASRPQPRPGTRVQDQVARASASGIRVFWHEQLKGRVRRVMDIEARTGQLDALQESGDLRQASGVVYRDNRPRARFRAPLLRYSKEHNRMEASRGVVITSIEPPGLTVTCDRVIWDTTGDKIVARGSVRLVHKPPGAAMPLATGTAEQVTIDTRMESFSIP